MLKWLGIEWDWLHWGLWLILPLFGLALMSIIVGILFSLLLILFLPWLALCFALGFLRLRGPSVLLTINSI